MKSWNIPSDLLDECRKHKRDRWMCMCLQRNTSDKKADFTSLFSTLMSTLAAFFLPDGPPGHIWFLLSSSL